MCSSSTQRQYVSNKSSYAFSSALLGACLPDLATISQVKCEAPPTAHWHSFSSICLDPSFRLTYLPAARKPQDLPIHSEETFNPLNRSDFEHLQSLSTWHDSIAVQARRKMIWCEMSRHSEAVVLLRGSAESRNRSSQTARTTKQRRTSLTRCSEDLSICFRALRQSAEKYLNLFFCVCFSFGSALQSTEQNEVNQQRGAEYQRSDGK